MTYEYVCQACGHQWEAQQPISADPLKDCPACGKAEAKRQISLGGGFILKGGGWYADLYGSSGAKSSGGASDSGGAAKSETKADSGSAASTTSSGAASSAPTATPSKPSDSSAA